MQALYSVDEIRALERTAATQLAPGTLMHRAGVAAAHAALGLLPAGAATAVLVLAGPGNNGGDALEVAANLADAGVDVTIVHLASGGAVAPETAQALVRARASSAVFADAVPAGARWSLLVDGLFGIGLARALAGAARALVEAANGADCPVLALDVPSGLDADTGAVVGGAAAIAVRATHTITFIGDKPGLHTGQGCDHAGAVSVATLDVTAGPARAELSAPALFAPYLQARASNSHKGSFGDVAVIGGAHGMAGAPVLSGRAALYAGAGRVFVAMLEPGPGYDSAHPELMMRAAAQIGFERACVVLGPGMGSEPLAHDLVARALASTAPLVIDADALNLIAATRSLQAMLPRAAPTIMTPHPLEAARLLGVDSAAVQADRLASARTLAARFGACVLVKGAGSVMARADGHVAINSTGNPGLATAGSGDVLAGLCGALLAQGWPAWEALVGAVWMHGAAADLLVDTGAGPIGLTAGELPAALRTVRNRLVAQFRPAGRPRW